MGIRYSFAPSITGDHDRVIFLLNESKIKGAIQNAKLNAKKNGDQ
jgi:hypothetical protein